MIFQGWRFVCDMPQCGEQYIDDLEVFWKPGTAPVMPILPHRWMNIGMQIICPKHQIAVDGEKF